ncbi:AMP-binding protein [Pseudomonas sp. 25 R 14]|uniref:AMP-binding protein n=1 Tax=Pseudomonas sp. 25 R 14 TaxID=1844109 RepID=UPI00081C0EF3|nr:AMP-binding protein [Pseudomonas sp. 25 R 14]
MVALQQQETLLHRFQHWSRKTPDRCYMTQPMPDGQTVEISWSEAWDQACRFAAWLKSQNLPAGSSIGLLGRNSAHWILADVGIWLAGHVTVPLYPTLDVQSARYVIEHSDIRLMVLGKLDGRNDNWYQLEQALPDELPRVGLPLSPPMECLQWEALLQAQAPLIDPVLPALDQLATIVYTSGSTGLPKGVMHSFGSMMAGNQSIGKCFNFSSEDRMLSYLPLAHVAERAFLEASSLCFGISVFFAHDLGTFQADLKRARPTIFFSVPRLWVKFYMGVQTKLPLRLQRLLFSFGWLTGRVKRMILQELGLDAVRVAFTGSAPLSMEIIQWYRQLGLELLDVYGMSENFGTSHISRPAAMRVGYVGSPAPGVECRLSEDGEVLVRSPGQMMGYYKSTLSPAETMSEDGYFRTGDLGELDDQGRLRITGRTKDLFKTAKGKYVAPVPIEQQLTAHALIEDCCVCGAGMPQPIALIVLAEGVRTEASNKQTRAALELELKTLLANVNKGLSREVALHCVVVMREAWTVESGLLTPTMKIKRHAIEQAFAEHADRWSRMDGGVLWQ